jgi:Ran-binding protein 3
MVAKQENGSGSDNDSGEKPVREKLQKATIDAEKGSAETDNVKGEVSATSTSHTDTSEQTVDTTAGSVGRLEKKRSHEDMEEGVVEEDSTTQHTRKRSRDGRAEDTDSAGSKRRVAEDEDTDDRNATSGDQPSTAETIAEQNDEPASAGDSTDDKAKDTTTKEKLEGADQGEQSEPSKGASLKRPGTPENKLETDPEAAIKSITSPKSKRSRHLESSITDKELNGTAASTYSKASAKAEEPDAAKGSAPEAAATKDAPSASALPSQSGFGNASSASPFGALGGSKLSTEAKPNSSDSFQKSGFAALAGKPMSGFGSLGATSTGLGNFASGSKDAKSGTKETETKPLSTFGGALGQKSAFGAAPAGGSVFGSGTAKGGFGAGFGSAGFGALAGAPGGLSSFASGRPAAAPATKTKPAKAFGAPADDEDEEDDNENDDEDEGEGKEGLSTDPEESDPRFFAQESVTGEEEERTEFNNRAKLYYFGLVDGVKQWRERGSGVLRLNVKKPSADEPDAQPQARLLMRADGSHRVVLNTIVKKELKFGDPQGGPPQGGSLLFMGTIPGVEEDNTGKLELLQIRVRHRGDFFMKKVRPKTQADTKHYR